MNLLAYLLESRGVVNSMQRLPTIATRFGISAAKMERALNRYVDLAQRYGTVPTLAVTANLIGRHPRVFTRLAERGADLAIHGWVHTDYRQLDALEQRHHIALSLRAFDEAGISVSGFRCPYVRWNEDTVWAASDIGLQYGSNRTIAWDVMPSDDGLAPRALEAYRKGLRLYGSSDAGSTPALPSFVDGLLDLPASLPDDEALVDRLRAAPEARASIWRAILDNVYRLGEMFVLILHHERLELCASALEATLEHSRGRRPHVWLAPLSEISEWWLRRSCYRLELARLGERCLRLIAPADPDVTVLARNIDAGIELQPWSGGWSVLPERELVLHSATKPCIGVDEDAAPALSEFLEAEGYVVHPGDDDCSLYLGGWSSFEERDKRHVNDLIEQSAAPLVRLWRWPRGARCAMSLTGDVDSMSLVDFLRRPLEV